MMLSEESRRVKSNWTKPIAFDVTVKSKETTFSLKPNVMGVFSINTMNESIGIEIESTLGGRISFNLVVSVYVSDEN